jgi:hypothetical protein
LISPEHPYIDWGVKEQQRTSLEGPSVAPSRSQSQLSHNLISSHWLELDHHIHPSTSSIAEHSKGDNTNSTTTNCLDAIPTVALLLVDAAGVAAGFTVVTTGLGLAKAASGAGEAAESPGLIGTWFDGLTSS